MTSTQTSDAISQACPGCKSAVEAVLREEPARIYRCESCELAFDPAVGLDAPDLYDDEYFDAGGYSDYVGNERQWRREARKRLEFVRGHVATPARLLEIGAAAGFFIDEAKSMGFDPSGVELAPGMAKMASERAGVPVAHGPFQDVELPPGPFDVICAWHTLEHVPDPHPFLARVIEVLGSGGTFAVEVPNVESRTLEREGSEWQLLQPGFHALHFSAGSMRNLLEAAGFEVIVSETLFQAAYTPPGERLRPDRLARRAARAVSIGSLGFAHPTDGDFVRAIAQVP